MFLNILKIDQELTKKIFIYFPKNNFLNHFFGFFSFLDYYIFFWILILIIWGFFIKKKHFSFLKILFFGILISYLFSNILLKNIIQRQRPSFKISTNTQNTKDYLNLVTIEKNPRDFSFPSSHSSVAFTAAFILSFFYKKKTYLFYSLALLIALSRIYFGVHFLFDIMFGALIGYYIGFFSINFFNKNEIKRTRIKKS